MQIFYCMGLVPLTPELFKGQLYSEKRRRELYSFPIPSALFCQPLWMSSFIVV